MSQLDSKGVVGTTHLLKGQLIFVLCVWNGRVCDLETNFRERNAD